MILVPPRSSVSSSDLQAMEDIPDLKCLSKFCIKRPLFISDSPEFSSVIIKEGTIHPCSHCRGFIWAMRSTAVSCVCPPKFPHLWFVDPIFASLVLVTALESFSFFMVGICGTSFDQLAHSFGDGLDVLIVFH